METDVKEKIAAARREKKKQARRKRAGVAARIALAAVFVIALASFVTLATFKDVRDFFTVAFSQGSYPAPLSDSAPLSVTKMSMAYCVATADEILVLSQRGELLTSITSEKDDLGVAVSKNKIAVYHIRGTDFSLYNRSQKIYDAKTDMPIISAAVSAGYVAVLCESDGYKAELALYNLDAERVFTWYCASDFPYAVFFNAKADRLLVAAAAIESGVLATRVTVIDIKGMSEVYDKPITLPFSAAAIYADGDRFTAVGNTAVALVENGVIVRTTDYDGLSLLAYDRYRNGDLAVCLGDNNMPAANRVLLFDDDHEKLFDIKINAPVRDVAIENGRVYVLTDSEVIAYSRSGEVAKRYDSHYNTVAIAVFRNIIEILPDTAYSHDN